MIPHFENKEELFDWLIANKTALVAQKKSAVKYADTVVCPVPLVNEKGEAVKGDVTDQTTKIKVRSIINTTKLMDSHSDVHIDQLWNKSLKETKDNYLVQEHDFSFKGIISDNVKAFTKQMTWKELGFEMEGQTQALVFDSVIDKSESPVMFEKYRTGKVKNHSVGMRYMKMEFAINDARYEEEKATWDKYINEVANKDAAEAQGYFWAILEAKVIEGSAVIRGSNPITPTQSIEAAKSTPIDIEPPLGTQTKQLLINPNLF